MSASSEDTPATLMVSGGLMMGGAWLFGVIFGSKHASCNTITGAYEDVTSNTKGAMCTFVNTGFDLKPFVFWIGLLVLVCGIGAAVSNRANSNEE
jgi:hypothetical protein